MSLDFEMYELKGFPSSHMEMDIVWLMHNKNAKIIVSWLYNNYIPRNEYDYTIMYQISSYQLDDLLQSINEVLSHDKHSIDFYMSFLLHFTLYQNIPGWSSYVEKDFIYEVLVDYKKKIKKLILDENNELIDKEFIYQIGW